MAIITWDEANVGYSLVNLLSRVAVDSAVFANMEEQPCALKFGKRWPRIVTRGNWPFLTGGTSANFYCLFEIQKTIPTGRLVKLGTHSCWTKELHSSSLYFLLSFQKFFLQESPVFYVQTLQDPSKALVLEEATLSWRQTCPGIINGALELESNGHASEGVTRPGDALEPEEEGKSLGPELHKINLVVSKVALFRPCRQAACQALRTWDWELGQVPHHFLG